MAERSKTFCPLPFIHSHASVNGHWKPCCNSSWKYDTKDGYFVNKKITHQKWFDSEVMEQLRSDLLSGVKNSMCNVCWKDEEHSGRSIRKRYVDKFSHLVNEDIHNPQIKYLDLKLSNECNLACRMCDYTNSNLILKDVKEIQKRNLTLPENWEKSPTHESMMNEKGIKVAPKHIIDEIYSLLPQLRVLKLTGGEPTVSPEVLKLFEICIDEGYAKNLKLNITTNGTKFNSRFLEKIKHFKDVHLNISCDGYDKVYNYIRYPFNWNKFAERIDDIAQGNVSFSISTLPQMYNIENLDKLQTFFNPYFEDGGSQGSIFVNTFLRPENTYNSLNFVPLHILQYANKKIKRNNNSHVLKGTLERLIRKNYQPTDADNIKIVKSITSIDTVRNQNYKDYLEPMTVEWLEGLFKKYA